MWAYISVHKLFAHLYRESLCQDSQDLRREGKNSFCWSICYVLLLLLLLSRFSCVQLCDPRDGSPPGSPVPGILQARTLEWGCHFLLKCMQMKSESEVAQSCPTLSDPMDCSSPGSSIHGIFQARVLEWGAIAFSDIKC